jgi:hypothetical protein
MKRAIDVVLMFAIATLLVGLFVLYLFRVDHPQSWPFDVGITFATMAFFTFEELRRLGTRITALVIFAVICSFGGAGVIVFRFIAPGYRLAVWAPAIAVFVLHWVLAYRGVYPTLASSRK